MKNSRIVVALILAIASTGYYAKRDVAVNSCRLQLQEERIWIEEDGCTGSTPVLKCIGECESESSPLTFKK